MLLCDPYIHTITNVDAKDRTVTELRGKVSGSRYNVCAVWGEVNVSRPNYKKERKEGRKGFVCLHGCSLYSMSPISIHPLAKLTHWLALACLPSCSLGTERHPRGNVAWKWKDWDEGIKVSVSANKIYITSDSVVQFKRSGRVLLPRPRQDIHKEFLLLSSFFIVVRSMLLCGRAVWWVRLQSLIHSVIITIFSSL